MAVTASNRQIRKAVNAQAAEVDAHRNLLQQVINDELVTRRRVDALEEFRAMTFRQRVGWFVRGY